MKRFIAFLCTIAMLFSMTAFAVEGTPTLTVDTVTAEAGKSVTVPIQLTGNTGMVGATIRITYDSKLTLTGITQGSALASLIMTKPKDLLENPFNLMWDGTDADTTDGIIASLTFAVPNEAGLFEISVACDSAYDNELSLIEFATQDGGIMVPGIVTDATLSGSVTIPIKNTTDTSSLSGTNVIGTVSWNPELIENTFAPNTVYTATITVAPEGGYIFSESASISFEDYSFSKNDDGNYVATKTFPNSSTKISYTGTNASAPAIHGDNTTIIGAPATVTLTAQNILDETVEYAKNSTPTAPETEWQDSNIFDNLPAGTYYFFARVKENDDHLAGLPSAASNAVTVAEATQVVSVTAPTFNAVDYGYGAVAAENITIENSGNSAATIASVKVSDTNKFTVSGGGSTVSAGSSIATWEIAPATGLDAGTHTATITVTYDTGKTAIAAVSFDVEKKAISINAADSVVAAKTYNGSDSAEITSVVFTGSEGDQILSMTADYTISNAKFNSANVSDATTITATIALVDNGPISKNYTLSDGSFTKTAAITPKDLPSDAIQEIEDQCYTGQAIEPALVVKDGSRTLELTTDYTVSGHSNNTAVGTDASVTITGAGNYTGTATKAFSIVGADYIYSVAGTQNIKAGSGLSAITVVPASGFGIGNEAVTGTHSWYKDSNRSTPAQNTDISGAAIDSIVTLYWSFTASTANYSTTPKTGSTAFTIVAGDSQTLSFNGVTANSVTKTYGDGTFQEAATQSVGTGAISYSSAVPTVATVSSDGTVSILKAGTTTITATAAAVAGEWAETSISYTLTVNPKNVTTAMISTIPDQPYTGSAITPEPTITDVGALIKGIDFDYGYEDNINAGTATLKINGKGNYGGTVSKNFAITQAPLKGTPTISGIATVGQTLTAVLAEITDSELTWQWLRNDVIIPGANTKSYELVAADSNKEIKVKVTAAISGNYTGNVTSAGTTVAKMSISGNVTMSETDGGGNVGKVEDGDTFTVVITGINPSEARDAITYEWFLNDTKVGTETSYTVSGSSAGDKIKVTVAATGDYQGGVTSAELIVGKQILTGTLTIDTTNGTTIGDELSIIPLAGDATYTWLRDGIAIPGATTNSYTLTKDDLGKTIAVKAIGTGDYDGEIFSTGVAISAIVPESPVVRATAGNTQISVSWTAPFNGGSSIIGYTVQIGDETPVNKANNETRHTFIGLTNGQDYTIKVIAINAIGNSLPGSASASPKAGSSNPGSTSSGGNTGGTTTVVKDTIIKGSTVTENRDGSVTTKRDATITVGADLTVSTPAGTTVKKDGTVVIPSGKTAEIELEDGTEIVLSSGSEIAPTGEIAIGDGATVTLLNETEIKLSKGSKIAAGGTITVGSDGAKLANELFEIQIDAGDTLIPKDDSLFGYVRVYEAGFADVPSDAWYNSAVQGSYENGIMSGVDGDKFAPTDKLNRGMMMQILFNINGKPSSNGNIFDDITNNAWYADAVSWAAQSNIVSGYGDGRFGPNDSISREQMAVILHNFCQYKGIKLPTVTNAIVTDKDNISSWAIDAVESIYKAGILSGKGGGAFDPKGTATRAEVAQMMMNFVEATK